MSARDELVARIVDDVAAHGLGDRSLRDLASAVGSSHRMLLYHFGSRAGVVAAVVDAVEAAQRTLLGELAAEVDDAPSLMRALWAHLVQPELRPFVRLFFECVGATGGTGLTDPWLETASTVAALLGEAADEVDLRLGVAVTRGLLIDVLASGDATAATASFERFVELWSSR